MLAVLIAIAVLAVPASAAAQDKPAPPAADGRWIVVYEPGAVSSVDRETDARERRRGFRSRLRFKRAIEGFAARLSPAQVRALRADPDVRAVVPDLRVTARAAQPLAAGEPLAPTGVRRIGAATQTWVREAADTGVAVIDTGVDLDHPDLNVSDGVNCVTPGTPADDDDGHGTHVAGTIGARNNGAGVTGVAPGTRVHAVKVLDSNGSGDLSQVVCGIDWAIANASARNIRVLNLSLGTLGENNRNCGVYSTGHDALHAAICSARDAGLLSVVAAGNGDPNTGIGWNLSENPPDIPASYPEVLTVSAIADGDGAPGSLSAPPVACSAGSTGDDTPARFSNFTRAQEEAVHMIAAPGVCINSTWPGGTYRSISGTSMATPHVAAAAALCVGEAGAPGPCAGLSPAQMIQRLRADAEAFRAANPGSGYGGDTNAPPDPVYGPLVRPVLNAPQTSFTAVPADTTNDSTPSFEFASATPGARFECSLDGGAFAACASPHTTSELADGSHQLAVRAVDVAGSPDASPAVDTFTVDAVPDPPPPPPPPPAPPADTTAPNVSLALVSRQRIATVSRNGLRVGVTCSESCRLDSRVIVSGKEALRLRIVRRRVDVTAGRRAGGLASGRRTVVIRLTSVVRKRLAGAGSALVQLRVVATDAAGNERTVRRSIRLVR